MPSNEQEPDLERMLFLASRRRAVDAALAVGAAFVKGERRKKEKVEQKPTDI